MIKEKVTTISTETITRVFDLHPIDSNERINYNVFGKFSSAVNKLIKSGQNCEEELFRNDSLNSVKRFYNKVTQNPDLKRFLKSLEIRERLVRCAAQYAYFAVRNTIQIKDLYNVIAKILSEKSHWMDFPGRFWDYWESTKRVKKYSDKLPSQIIGEIRTEYYSLYPLREGWLNSTVIQNYYIHLKKHLIIDLEINITNLPFNSEKYKTTILYQYNQTFINSIIARFTTNVSSILTRKFKKMKKQSKTSKKQKETRLAKTIYQICGTKRLTSIESEEWQLKK